jgi:hypothetical protein
MYLYMGGAHLYAFALSSSYARSQDHGNNKLRQACTYESWGRYPGLHSFPSPFDPRPICGMPSNALNKGKQHNREYRDFMSNYSGSLVFFFRRPHKDRPPGTKCRCSQLGLKRDNITGYARCEYLKVKPGSMASKNLP